MKLVEITDEEVRAIRMVVKELRGDLHLDLYYRLGRCIPLEKLLTKIRNSPKLKNRYK